MSFSLPALFPLHLYAALRFLLVPLLGLQETRTLREAAAGSATAPNRVKLQYFRSFCIANLISGTASWVIWSLLPQAPLQMGKVLGMPLQGLFAAFAIGGGIGGVLGEGIELLLLRRKDGRSAAKRRKLFEAKMYALPASPRERRWWIAVSCMAGYGEELTFRAFLIAYLLLFFHVGVGWTLAISSLIFGFAHLGKGIRSVVTTTLFGCLFGMAYLGTGYIWYAMLLHALFNLRLLPELRIVGLMRSEPAAPETGPSPTLT